MAKILVVDDKVVYRNHLRKILEDGGHEVFEADSALYAIRVVYPKVNPDLVTMDIQMPGMNGVKAVKMIVAQDINAKIIMISTEAQRNNLFDSLRNGAKSFIVKPYESETVIEIVDKVLNS